MEERLIRRVPVVNAKGECCGIVAQADVATSAPKQAEEVVREISKATSAASNM
jgi:CBS domain-containing protein